MVVLWGHNPRITGSIVGGLAEQSGEAVKVHRAEQVLVHKIKHSFRWIKEVCTGAGSHLGKDSISIRLYKVFAKYRSVI